MNDDKDIKIEKTLLGTFESYKKNMNKKEKNYQIIKDSISKIKTNISLDNIKELCILCVEPVENPNLKIISKMIKTINYIIDNNLINNSILQVTIQHFLLYLPKIILKIEFDFELNSKIMNILIKILSLNSLYIHNEYFSSILKVFLKMILSTKNNQDFQTLIKTNLHKLIDILINNYKNSWDYNINIPKHLNFYKNYEDLGLESTTKLELFNKILFNEYNFICQQYLNYLIDLIVIQNKQEEESINIITKYINIIKNNEKNESLKNEIEKLNLIQYNDLLYNDSKIGKYGWCINCRKTSNNWDDTINFPICENKNCLNKIRKTIAIINVKNDYLNMIIYIFLSSNLGFDESTEENSNEIRLYCREFCLNLIQEIIERGSKYFINDYDLIFILKEFLKDSLFKNSLSNDYNIFTTSLNLFITIIKNYRENLKDQIEIFFGKILTTILVSDVFGFEYKNAILDTLINLTENISFFVEIYVNYDCDVNYYGVFQNLIDLLTKIMNGLYKKQKNLKVNEEQILNKKTLSFLDKFVHKLYDLVEYNLNKNNSNEIIDSNINQENSKEENSNISTESNSSNNTNFDDLKDKINKNLKIKKLLQKAIELFNFGKSSNDCLNYLKTENLIYSEESFNKIKEDYIKNLNIALTENIKIEEGKKNILSKYRSIISEISIEETSNLKNLNIMQKPFISNINPLIYLLDNTERENYDNLTYENYIAFEMARFIRTNLKELKREKVGDYLCSGKPFNIIVVAYFINSFDFKKLHILDCLRLLFNELPLIGEGQIIGRIIQIFGSRYHKENPSILKDPDIAYYLAYLIIILNTDLHRDEVDQKMTIKQFIDSFNQSYQNQGVSEEYLSDIYYKILNDPIVIPGQSLSKNKKNKDFINKERKNIYDSTIKSLQNISSTYNNFIKEIDNDNIKSLIEYSWSNFLSIFSQQLLVSNDIDIIKVCLDDLLTMTKTLSILRLNKYSEAFINTVINMININDKKELGIKNIECIKHLIQFASQNGKYIKTKWESILNIVSKIEYYQFTNIETITKDIQNKSKTIEKEKEIEITLINREIINNNIIDVLCDNIFSNTITFDEEAIVNFVQGLCKVSINELNDYFTPRIYSLHKLVEVAEFNIKRIQAEWVKIWKPIGAHLIYVIININNENICTDALDNLKQIICKLLQKKDLFIYNFQMNFVQPFHIIFSQSKNEKIGEMVLNYINYIIGTYSKIIYSGWIVIFKILKEGLRRNNSKLNEEIKNILQKINEDFSLIYNNLNSDVFKGYVECLCLMYLKDNLKEYSFDTIFRLFSKIIYDKLSDDNKEKNGINLQYKNKKYELAKIFLYGFDELINIDFEKYLNLIFDVIDKNLDIIISTDIYLLIYLYYGYFKTHICCLLFNFMDFNLNFFDNNILSDEYTIYRKENNIDDKFSNIQLFLNFSILEDIKKIGDDKFEFIIKKEETNKLNIIMKKIKESYDKENHVDLLYKKLILFNSINSKFLSRFISSFLDKIFYIFEKIEKKNYNFIYYYNDLIVVIFKLSFFNKENKSLIDLVTQKIQLNYDNSINLLNKIYEENIHFLKYISSFSVTIEENTILDLISFFFIYSNFILNLTVFYVNDVEENYKIISEIFLKFLQMDSENKFKTYKIIELNQYISLLLVLQNIKQILLQKIKNPSQQFQSLNILLSLHKIFLKYKLDEINSPFLEIINNELEIIFPQFLKVLNEEELNMTFNCLMDLIDSDNQEIRTSSKNILSKLVNDELCIFNTYEEIKN